MIFNSLKTLCGDRSLDSARSRLSAGIFLILFVAFFHPPGYFFMVMCYENDCFLTGTILSLLKFICQVSERHILLSVIVTSSACDLLF